MSVISRGQITIVDLSDGKSINLYLGSSLALTQIYNRENTSYTPDWSVNPFLVITPEVYVTGIPTNQISRLKGPPTWKINGSSTLSTYGATAATSPPYALTVKNNMASYAQMMVECEVVYVDPDTTAETRAKSNISFAKTENTGQLICAIAYAPNGTVFKNGSATSLKAHCDMWRGSIIDNTLVAYKWYKLGSGAWTEIVVNDSEGVKGYTSNEIDIPSAAVLNFESFKCEIRDDDPASGTYNTTVADIISFADMSDPYQVEITTPQGTVLTSGLTKTTLTAQVWQNGALLTDSFFTGSTCRWRKFDKYGVLDTEWGSAGVKTGRSITVTRGEVSVAATFTVEIEK